MGTRALVGILIEHETMEMVEFAFNHWDGYTSDLGKKLKNMFNTESKVKSLISGGGWSSIDDNGYVDYYSHRGDDITVNCVYIDQYNVGISGTEFVYLYMDNEWYFKSYDVQSWTKV